MDLTGWIYLFTFGYCGDVYGKDKRRVMVDRESDQVEIEYQIDDRGLLLDEEQRLLGRGKRLRR